MQFQELTDKQWRMMQKYIPKPARTGRPRSNDRVTINGIMFVLVTGCRWREMPEKYAQNQLHIAGYRTGSKGKYGKIFCQVQ